MTLEEFRAREGLNLTQLAERLGRPVSTVHGWLRGTRRPDWASLDHIAAATGGIVSVADFAAPPAGAAAPGDARPRTRRERAAAPVESLAEEAAGLGLDAAGIMRRALSDAIGQERGRRWQAEHRESIEAWNRWHEEHGLALAEYRMF